MPKYQRHLVEDHIRLIRNILSEIEEHNASLEEFNLEQMQDLVSKIYSLRDFLTFDVTNPITKQELFDKYLPEDFIKYLRVLSVEMSQDPSIKQKIYEVNAEQEQIHQKTFDTQNKLIEEMDQQKMMFKIFQDQIDDEMSKNEALEEEYEAEQKKLNFN